MNIAAPPPQGHVRLALSAEEAVHVLHTKAIVAYRGAPGNREDRFMDLAGAFRKRKWTRARLQGPCEFLLGLPQGCTLETVDIPAESDLLFDFRHVMFFSDGMTTRSRIQKLRTAWITKELVRMQFGGPGTLGILSLGGIAAIELDPERPLYVDAGSLVAFPHDAGVRLSVYGNPLASQQMNVQWELTGRGPVLVQTGLQDPELMEQLRGDGVFKRLLRELLPFGSVYIK